MKKPSGSTTSKSPISSATSGPRRPIRLCAGGRRCGQPRRVTRRRRSARPSSSSRKPLKDGSISSIGTEFRAKLHLEAEPAIDPEHVNIDELPLSRLSRVPLDRLDDDRVLALYRRAREWGVRVVTNRVARLIDSPARTHGERQDRADNTLRRTRPRCGRTKRPRQAMRWLARGVESDPPLKRSANALAWEMIELQVQMVLDGPEVWVPSLAVILERYRGNQEATSAVFLRLINLGLVQVVQDPNRPDQMALDTRMLEHYLSQYGPRVTTASGQLGVAATRGEIWTPESAAAAAAHRSGRPGPRASRRGRRKTVDHRHGPLITLHRSRLAPSGGHRRS